LPPGRNGSIPTSRWTFGCINCIHNYPAYKAWQDRFAGRDVTIVGVHTPEFASEKVVASVRQKARENGLKFPVVIDNDNQTWRAWRNRYWPAVYLIDRQGFVRYHWEGELGTDGEKTMRGRIEELLAEKP
jgi:peroxiredoxin